MAWSTATCFAAAREPADGLAHPPVSPSTAAHPTHASTIVVDEGRERVWSVNPDSDTVTSIKSRELVKLFEVPVGDNPRTLALAPNNAVWVVNQDDATISVLEASTGRLRESIILSYASRPYGIAVSPKGDTAYVTLQALGRLLKLDTSSRQVIGDVDVGPTPRGIAVSGDGNRILVTRYVSPAGHGEVTEVNARTFEVTRRFELAIDPGPDSPISGRGVPNQLASITIAPNGQRAWIPSKKDNTGRGLQVSGEPLGFETTTRTMVSQLDLAANREVLSARRDLDNRAMAVAVAFDQDGEHAFVALQGTNAVDVLSAETSALTASIPRTGLAPQGLVVDERGHLFVQNFLSRDLAVYDVSDLAPGQGIKLIGRITAVEREPLAPELLLGKQIFHNAADPRMSRDGYVSCASCHLEGGGDGRVWDFSGRGAHGGGLRNTITLFGRAGLGHGPVHWRADIDEIQDFEILIRTTLQGRGFVTDAVFNAKGANWVFGPPNAGLSRELDALAAYVASFERVNPSPYRRPGGAMTPQALAGEAIFHSRETGCAACHAGRNFTDSSLRRTGRQNEAGATAGASHVTANAPFTMHDVGTLSEAAGDFNPNTLRALDTPTVKGVWETPPYLHDGSAATLMDVITMRNVDDRHGKTTHLTVLEKESLVAYLQQLDDTIVDTSLTISRTVAATPRTAAAGTGLGFRVRATDRGGVQIERATLVIPVIDGQLAAPVRARIHFDSNDDGWLDAGEPLLAESSVAADGTASLTISPPPIVGAGSTASFVVRPVTGSATESRGASPSPGRHPFNITLTEIHAKGLTSKGQSVVVGLPIQAKPNSPASAKDSNAWMSRGLLRGQLAEDRGATGGDAPLRHPHTRFPDAGLELEDISSARGTPAPSAGAR